MGRITCVRDEDVVALCPHCEAELGQLVTKKPKGGFGVGQGFLFICPSCHKVLGGGAQWYPFPARS